MLNDLSQIFRDELHPGERLLWSGQPRQGLVLRPSDAVMIPFSLLWGGFAIVWETAVLAGGAPFFFGLWGIPFVLMGLYMIVGRFFADAWQRSKTYYAVTNERVLILSTLFNRNVRALNLKNLYDINLNVHNNGRGSIIFGTPHPMAAWYGGFKWPGTEQYTAPTFELIEEARMVYDTVQRAQREKLT
jgi:hypothetical protein